MMSVTDHAGIHASTAKVAIAQHYWRF